MNDKIFITGCSGSGINHIRLLLGMSPGREIRDLSGRLVADPSKFDFVMRVMYNDIRTSTGKAPVRNGHTSWGQPSYWLRMEWLTRETYTESTVTHDPEIVDKKQSSGDRVIFVKVGDVDLVTRLYLAKCPGLNGSTYNEELERNRAWQTVPAGVDAVVVTDDLYRRDWASSGLAKVLDQIGYAPVHLSDAEKIHHRWCDLNDRLLERSDKNARHED